MKERNQKIKCEVESCKYQNEGDDGCCDLEQIQVGCDCGAKKVTTEKGAICKSFECDDCKVEK